MKKHALLLSALLGLAIHFALAMPGGWYGMNTTWQDRGFNARLFYDSRFP